MKKLKLFFAALVLGVSTVSIIGPSKAFAATVTWDGGGSDTNMTTAANWSTDVPPVPGDSLVFPVNVTNRTVVNDFTAGTSFSSITFSGIATANSNYTISGNSMALTGGITNSMTGSFALSQTISMPLTLSGDQTLNSGNNDLTLSGTLGLGSGALTINTGTGFVTLSGVVSGTGSITKSGSGYLVVSGANTYSGATTVSAGQMVVGSEGGLGTAAAGTTVASGASLYLYKSTDDLTYSEPLNLSGTGLDAYNATLVLATGFNSGGGGSTSTYPTTTFSGAITLGSDIKVAANGRHGKITGSISGSHAISLLETSSATFQIASSSNNSSTSNSTLAAPVKETTYSADSSGTAITVNTNETAIVTGKYGSVNVGVGGKLKGTGTVGTVSSSGTIAPGLSPGCLVTGDLSMFSGSYEFELGGTTACSGYDQIQVTGAVQLAGALSASIYNSFKPVAGQKYVIISNDGSDAVSGTFDSLAQGATLTVGGNTLSISYTGGDGNDVELTVTAAAPNTGFGVLKNNLLISTLMIGAAGIIALVAKRSLKPSFSSRKR